MTKTPIEQEETTGNETPNNWKKNEMHTVEITGYTAEGAGVGRVDGRVVFVPHTIRGEVWEVNLVKVNRNFAFGRGVTCLTGSPHRVEKDCDFRGKCGGCQFRHMSYEEELNAKREHIQDAFQRLAGISMEIPPVLGAEEPNRYRNKVQFPVSGSDKWVKIGFYRPRSHDVLDVADCLLQQEDSAIAREVVKQWMCDYRVNPYDESTGKGTIRHLFLRNNGKGELLLCLVATREKLPKVEILLENLQKELPNLVGILVNVHKKDSNVVLGNEIHCLWGQDFLYEELSGLRFKLSVPSFFQVNLAQTKVLYEQVAEFAQLTGEETVLDLYCGIGTIGLLLAKDCKKVMGAEIVAEAVANAQENAKDNNIQNAEFFHGDAIAVAERCIGMNTAVDVLVVDPPRKGLSPEVPELLGKIGAKKLIYVSCDGGTLARDLKRLMELGYSVEKAQPVDLFPRTRHVETVVLLTKS